jgi:hypothetical protein
MNSCVYFHINPLKNEIFYVGIGSKKRPYNKKGRNRHWNNIVNKYGYIINVSHDNLTWENACKLEQFYINKLGRKDLGKGSLVNLTDGGEGANGIARSEELRKRLRELNLGKKQTKEAKEKQIKAQTGRKHSEETKKKMSEWQIGRKMSDEFKKHKSESQLGEKNHMFGKKISDETKQKMALARIKYYENKRNSK